MNYTPTQAQEKIYSFIENGTGNGIIDAVAGAGKTTTLMDCVKHIPNIDDVIYCAFNTSIRKELQKKFKKANLPVKVCTIHSLGYQLLRARGIYMLNDYKYNEIVKDPQFFETLIPEIDVILDCHSFVSVAELRELEERRDILDWDEKNQLNEGQQYVHKILKRLLDINQKYRCTLEEDNVERYDAMIAHFGIIPSWERAEPHYKKELVCYFKAHQKLLKEGNSMAISHSIIDYTDQLYLPFVMNLTAKQKYGFVFVDECQDLSKAQVNIVKQYLRDDGRLLAVGDPYQAIYGFAGADSESFDRVRKSFNCQVLGLTDCFRCPQDVICIAQSIREDINGFKDYPGKIYVIHQREVIINVKEGDLIICRTRKPLMAMALKLITKNFKVKIHPDELQEFMGDYKKNFTPQELRRVLSEDMIDDFFEKARQRNEKRIERDNQNADSVIRKMIIKEEVEIMRNTLNFLKRKFFDWKLNTLDSILTRLKRTLSSPSEKAIKISTIHRAKGLENDRVFILEYNKLPYKRELEWENIQERNLHYVAVTRPKEELYLCDDQLITDGDEEALDENQEPAKPVNDISAFVKTQDNTEPVSTVKSEELNLEHKMDSIEVPFLDEKVKETETEPMQESRKKPLNPFSDDSNDFLDFLAATSPIIDVPSITIRAVQKISKIPKRFYSFDDQDDTPYSSLTRPCQKAKYWAIYENLQDTEYSVSDIVSSQYLDEYYINTPNGVEIYKGYYKDSGQYNFSPRGNYRNAEQLKRYFEDESNYKIKFEYNPINNGFEDVHELIQAVCQELGLCNTNIFPENNAIVYCFKSFNSHICIKLIHNNRNRITTIAPSSTLGENDEKLKILIESLKSLWQQ